MSDVAVPSTLGLIAPRSGNAKPLLYEMLRLLERLEAGGDGGSIDLRTIPLTNEDLTTLKAVLGDGAVDARVEALGESHVCETRFPGIWWVTHRNGAGEMVAESLEICAVPAILCTPIDDMADAAARLRQALAETLGEGS